MSLILEELFPDNLIRIIISAIMALGITWSSIPVIRIITTERNLSDSPIKRSSHKTPTPTFGGVGIFAGTMIGYMFWNFNDEGYLMHKIFASTIILFFLGIKDDIFALNPGKKAISQILVASLVVVGSDLRVSNFFGVFGIHEIPYLISVIFTIFLIVALINAFNLIDGIDGLSGGIGMIASGGFALWFMLNGYWSMAALGISLSASLLAFLRFNYSITSKIFMGDTGSMIVGFWVGIMALYFIEVNVTNTNPNSVYVTAPLIAIALLSVPVFDTLRVFSIRLIRGKSPFKADRLHFHHLLIDLDIPHHWVSVILYSFTIILTVTVYMIRGYFTNTQMAFGILTLFLAYLSLNFYLEKKRLKYHKSKLILEYQSEGSDSPAAEVVKKKIKQN